MLACCAGPAIPVRASFVILALRCQWIAAQVTHRYKPTTRYLLPPNWNLLRVSASKIWLVKVRRLGMRVLLIGDLRLGAT